MIATATAMFHMKTLETLAGFRTNRKEQQRETAVTTVTTKIVAVRAADVENIQKIRISIIDGTVTINGEIEEVLLTDILRTTHPIQMATMGDDKDVAQCFLKSSTVILQSKRFSPSLKRAHLITGGVDATRLRTCAGH